MTAQEPTDNRRRLAALAGLIVLWGACLVTIGFDPVLVAPVVVAGVAAAALAFEGRRIRASVSAWALDIHWRSLRDRFRRHAQEAARLGTQGMEAVRRALVASYRRALAATRAARENRLPRRSPPPTLESADGSRQARKLNEQAASSRQDGRAEEAIALGEQALQIFRSLGDQRGAALTLNGLGLAQARVGDEASAVDSYETAISLLTALGDTHSAGRVLANLGALHRGQGHDAQARACWNDALERFEPGSVEYDRTAQQLRLAG